MRWKPSVTLMLFLSPNHRKLSRTRARTAQRRLHVSAAESNPHQSSVLAPLSCLLTHRLWGPHLLPMIQTSTFPFFFFLTTPGWRCWMKAGHFIDMVSFVITQLHLLSSSTLPSWSASYFPSLGMCLCVTWGWIPVAMLYSCWALKPRQRRAGTSLIRAGVTVPDTQHSHTKDTPQPVLHGMQHNVKHGDIHRGRRRSRCSFAISAEVFECRQRRKHH